MIDPVEDVDPVVLAFMRDMDARMNVGRVPLTDAECEVLAARIREEADQRAEMHKAMRTPVRTRLMRWRRRQGRFRPL